ncbi:MAG: hypothetical protein A3F82_07940 [Deltaproteobacteria bacterium RIFCSPLOWO2_12_FULL_44_12]|nr:MAG: hypothetical protein A2712_07330 [Deltaproteobacteria bacterium RIFCSPHIGHO2_01_FULL_43_49]OGQ15756.1 MAG: hypothetical protein A3D22_06120 [Deltaproteobacteria bacterium RIFCSPHIGHO2_02_FULL_44_53]OGQ28725.1 MAG: hypothetical protein A3D98_00855 [Deltaproteobacteria bacterium RIFCSPHIGHO2_12_FULL_44_21]OGQ32049.1 MAG: hypothetical protein A2979_03065 [Deltaproteobacteria bacterium RIFCSPLOWO2_01_FULL_45_74]OGQ43660.1 MAG: hypothetical protein A3I70_03580 [Deltaproteobacteria bacterium 
MKRKISEFYRRSLRNQLIVVLSSVTMAFFLLVSTLSILAIRKDAATHFALGIDSLMTRQTTTLILMGLLTFLAIPILLGLVIHGILNKE